MQKWKQDPGRVKKNEGDLDMRIRNMLSTWKVNSEGGTAGDHSPSPRGGGAALVTRATGCNRYCVTRMKSTPRFPPGTMCMLPQLSTWGHS